MPLLLALIYVLLFSMALFSNVMLAKLGCGAIALLHGIELTKRVFNITATIPVVDKVNYILNAYFLALWGIIKYEKGDYKSHWQRVHTGNSEQNGAIKCVKRGIDIIGSALGLIVLSPVMLIVALTIKLTSRGPVLFNQLRVGESSDSFVALFNVLKFRSMVVDAEVKSGAVWASKDDPRITPVGRFIRKTRLDELPQLWLSLIHISEPTRPY